MFCMLGTTNELLCFSTENFSERRFCSSAIKTCFSFKRNDDIGLRCNSIFILCCDQAGLAGAVLFAVLLPF